MPAARPRPITHYSALQQTVAATLVVCLCGCSTTPPAKSDAATQAAGTETAVVGRLVLTRAGADQTPYSSTEDHSLCFVPDDVTARQAEQGMRAATLDADGTFHAQLPPGNYKLYSQHRIAATQWVAVLPMAQLNVTSLGGSELAYAGTLRVELEASHTKSWTTAVRQVPIKLTDERRQVTTSPDIRLVPALLHVKANVALAQTQATLQPCRPSTLAGVSTAGQSAKQQGAEVAKVVLLTLLLIPLVAIVVVLGVLSGGGGGSLKFPNR
jgi:hypothetical protein